MYEILSMLYYNIGRKIKTWAMWMFIIEALSAIISGILLILNFVDAGPYEFNLFMGIITILLGPVVAFVSTLLLYGFGELIEKTSKNEANTEQILKILKKQNDSQTKNSSTNVNTASKSENNIKASNVTTSTPESNIKASNVTVASKPESTTKSSDITVSTKAKNDTNIVCPSCGFEQKKDRTVCFKCGTPFPYYCGSCGRVGPYEGNCPECNSSIKKYPTSDNQ